MKKALKISNKKVKTTITDDMLLEDFQQLYFQIYHQFNKVINDMKRLSIIIYEISDKKYEKKIVSKTKKDNKNGK